MNDISFMVLKIVITILSTLITIYVIPLLKTKIQTSQYNYLLEIVDTAVRAAEQTIKTEKSGAVKKEKVIQYVTDWMNKHNVKISQEQLSEIIEWAVYTMNQEVDDGK